MRFPKPGSMDEALFEAFKAGIQYEAGGEGVGIDELEMLGAFRAWRERSLDPEHLPAADEPVPFPWDER